MTQPPAPSNTELAARMQKIIFAIEDVREDTLATDRTIESMDAHYSEVLDRVIATVDRQTDKLNEVVGKLNDLTGVFSKLIASPVKASEKPRRKRQSKEHQHDDSPR